MMRFLKAERKKKDFKNPLKKIQDVRFFNWTIDKYYLPLWECPNNTLI